MLRQMFGALLWVPVLLVAVPMVFFGLLIFKRRRG